jgi:hypothetical protein
MAGHGPANFKLYGHMTSFLASPEFGGRLVYPPSCIAYSGNCGKRKSWMEIDCENIARRRRAQCTKWIEKNKSIPRSSRQMRRCVYAMLYAKRIQVKTNKTTHHGDMPEKRPPMRL